MFSPVLYRKAGYAGRAYVLCAQHQIVSLGDGHYLVTASGGGDHEVDISQDDLPICDCPEYRSNLQTHAQALLGKKVVSPGLTCTHIVAARAFRGDFDLVEAIQGLPEPLRKKARAAAMDKRRQLAHIYA